MSPREPRNFDNDRLYRRPAAWKKAKEVFGCVPGDPDSGGDPGRAMLALEAHCREHGGCPRFLLTLAVYAYLALSDAERAEAMHAWSRAEGERRKAAEERRALDADFQAFISKVFGPDRPAA